MGDKAWESDKMTIASPNSGSASSRRMGLLLLVSAVAACGGSVAAEPRDAGVEVETLGVACGAARCASNQVCQYAAGSCDAVPECVVRDSESWRCKTTELRVKWCQCAGGPPIETDCTTEEHAPVPVRPINKKAASVDDWCK